MKVRVGTMLSRLKSADLIDWLYGTLFFAVGMVLVSIVYVLIHDEPRTFAPVSFAAPAAVVDEQSMVPVVQRGPGRNSPPVLPAPSITSDETVPVLLERIIDCSAHRCPSGGMAVEATISWERVGTDGNTLAVFEIATEVSAVYEQGEDYDQGELTLTRLNLNPFTVPEVVIDYLDENNLDVSAWRIDGISEVDGRQTAAWSTEVVHIAHTPDRAGQ